MVVKLNVGQICNFCGNQNRTFISISKKLIKIIFTDDHCQSSAKTLLLSLLTLEYVVCRKHQIETMLPSLW